MARKPIIFGVVNQKASILLLQQTGLFLLMLRTRIKYIGSNTLREDFNGGFSYIISSWLIEDR